MLGSVCCCRLSVSGKPSSCPAFLCAKGPLSDIEKSYKQQSVKVALPPTHPSSPHAHTFKFITRSPATATLPRTICRSRQARTLQQNVSATGMETCAHPLRSSTMTGFHHHASSCLLAANGKVGATIWHALLPANVTLLERDPSLPQRRALTGPPVGKAGTDPVADMIFGSAEPTLVEASTKSVATLRSDVLSVDSAGLPRLGGLNGRFAMAVGLREGSWNVAWDARPARWLHSRHSAWLLFGVCACFSAAAVPLISPSSDPALTEALAESLPIPSKLPPETEDPPVELETVGLQSVETHSGHGKEIHTDYSVTGIPGDGRCLFRAVAHGSSLRSGKLAPNENLQRELADELRNKVADELIKRRVTTEWFIEGDFDKYVERMRQPHVWGGEPELLMLSHVLEMPITVYMTEKESQDGLIAIAEYGQEYGKDNPIRVLYHGFGHYDALQIPKEQKISKL